MLSSIVAANSAVSTVKHLYDILGGVRSDRAELFEKVIKPIHSDAESVVKEYYRFFHFAKAQLGAAIRSEQPIPPDAFAAVEAAYSEGKTKRDALRALISEGRASAARRIIDISHAFADPNSGLIGQDYARVLRQQVRLTEQRWVAASQVYAMLCLKAYRR